MPRLVYYVISVLSIFFVLLLSLVWPWLLYLLIIIVPLILLGIHDILSRHNVLRNYPVIGHLRYMFEFVRPEIQQYFVATNLSGRPFNREIRTLVYKRAKGLSDTHPFGTEHDIDVTGYHYILHSVDVKTVSEEVSRIIVGNDDCKKPYNASRANISGMSFGAISKNAILAMNRGAKLGNFAQNTGEGGLTRYHLQEGGDLVWQIGTGYFGCRTRDAHFDEKKFAEKANLDQVKMIEIKISQGAKPSDGGILPAAKITPEIAEFRGIEMGKDCISPPRHSAFHTPIELLFFIQRLKELTGGKPVGFKICVGKRTEIMGICKAMIATNIFPDFITVDGAEGGTGAAPLEFSNRFGMPANEGIAFVHNCLMGSGLREKVRLICSGKIATGFDIITKIALGADICNMARTMMFATGCIQALRCHTNTCPTGVTTQDPWRVRALEPIEKSRRVAQFQAGTIQGFLKMLGAMGLNDPEQLQPEMIYLRMSEGESIHYGDVFHYIQPENFLSDNIHPYYKNDWQLSSAEHF